MLAKLVAKYSSEVEETNLRSDDDIHSAVDSKIYFYRYQELRIIARTITNLMILSVLCNLRDLGN